MTQLFVTHFQFGTVLNWQSILEQRAAGAAFEWRDFQFALRIYRKHLLSSDPKPSWVTPKL